MSTASQTTIPAGPPAMTALPDIAPFRLRKEELDAQMADRGFFSQRRRAGEVTREHQQSARFSNGMPPGTAWVAKSVITPRWPATPPPTRAARARRRRTAPADRPARGAGTRDPPGHDPAGAHRLAQHRL